MFTDVRLRAPNRGLVGVKPQVRVGGDRRFMLGTIEHRFGLIPDAYDPTSWRPGSTSMV